jgi:hypothetical protein
MKAKKSIVMPTTSWQMPTQVPLALTSVLRSLMISYHFSARCLRLLCSYRIHLFVFRSCKKYRVSSERISTVTTHFVPPTHSGFSQTLLNPLLWKVPTRLSQNLRFPTHTVVAAGTSRGEYLPSARYLQMIFMLNKSTYCVGAFNEYMADIMEKLEKEDKAKGVVSPAARKKTATSKTMGDEIASNMVQSKAFCVLRSRQLLDSSLWPVRCTFLQTSAGAST